MSKVGGREAVTVDEAAVLREHSRRREPVVPTIGKEFDIKMLVALNSLRKHLQQHMDLLPRERSLHHVGSSAQPDV